MKRVSAASADTGLSGGDCRYFRIEKGCRDFLIFLNNGRTYNSSSGVSKGYRHKKSHKGEIKGATVLIMGAVRLFRRTAPRLSCLLDTAIQLWR